MIARNDISLKKNQIILKISKEWAHMSLGMLKTEQNIDLLIALLRKYQQDGLQEYTLQFDEIKGQLMLMKDGSYRVDDKQLNKNLRTAMDNIAKVTAVYEDDDCIEIKTIFSKFKYDKKERTLQVLWNSDNIDLVEEMSRNALYLHRDFYRIDSKYAKILYISLSEWNNTKTREFINSGICAHTFSIEEFRHIMGIEGKASYTNKKNGTSNIMSRIIKPSIKELQDIFINLECIVKYQKTSKGKEISGYEFVWYPHDYIIDPSIKNAIQMKSEGVDPDPKQNKTKIKPLENSRQYDYDELEKKLLNK